ncbi:helix-turn-helix domain-containing protein [Arcanobacterium bovis]|uniref:XRE family transcriptional regulator n=1 Tax=Arcanobacterium bovis TaxID=2529275 RepID=A0A4Q9V457_9ACTO|nr:XRE family transcriptional regulator [Arcanobacterium bovis]
MTITDSFLRAMTVDEIIGERVGLWLRRRGHTQVSLAGALGLTKASISGKVTGRVSWSATDLVKTAAFLDLPIEALLPDETVELEKAKAPELVASRASNESHLWESNPRPIHYE